MTQLGWSFPTEWNIMKYHKIHGNQATNQSSLSKAPQNVSFITSLPAGLRAIGPQSTTGHCDTALLRGEEDFRNGGWLRSPNHQLKTVVNIPWLGFNHPFGDAGFRNHPMWWDLYNKEMSWVFVWIYMDFYLDFSIFSGEISLHSDSTASDYHISWWNPQNSCKVIYS